MAQIYSNLKLPPELVQNIKLLADVDGMTMIDYLRLLIQHTKTQRFLKARTEGNELHMSCIETIPSVWKEDNCSD